MMVWTANGSPDFLRFSRNVAVARGIISVKDVVGASGGASTAPTRSHAPRRVTDLR